MNIIRIYKIARQAVRNVFLHKIRSLLTSLGIIIGTVTVIVVIAIGVGAQQNIEEQYSNLSATGIFISSPFGGGRGAPAIPSELSAEDAVVVTEQAKYVELAVPQINSQTSVGSDFASDTYSVVGTSERFPESLSATFLEGEFFTAIADEDREKVAVLGYTVAENLFNEDPSSALGEYVRINRKDYEVIGVLEYRGGSTGGNSVDDSIYVPYSTAERSIVSTNPRISINALATTVDDIPAAMEEITEILREEHNLDEDDEDDFQLRDSGSVVSSASSSTRTMALLLISIASIVLIVGGVGIMNIMLVSVKERTKEIGIRKALGAKNYHILLQFIFEAAFISIVAALIGELVAIGVMRLLEQTDFTVQPVWWGYVLALVFSLAIGIFFGFYPARKASLLRPIEALRFE